VGEVRRAIERRTGIQRAVKVIPIKQTLGGGVAGRRNIRNNDSDTTAAVLTAEASLLQHLDHPYVVKLINVYTSPSAVYLVMELLQGGDLFDRIVLKGRYNEVEARRIMRRLLAAIYYLHEERHVVHRDLKPENILLQSRDSDVDIQLTDFGLAKSVTGSDCLKTFCGTPLYFAPEILQRRNTVMGRGRYNKQADMWSLGVILYILLSGSQPFDGDQWMNSPSTTPVDFPEEFWSGVSEPARDLVRRMLVEDPRRRITAQAACTHPWILEDDGDTHCHPLDDPKLPRNCRRSVPLPAPNPDDRASHSSAVKEETDSSITSVPRDILLLRNAGNCGNTGHGECAESHPSAIGQGNLRIATVDREDDATKAIDAAARIADKGVSWMPSVEDAGQAILKPTVDSLFTSENASARCHAAATQGVENSELSDDGILSQFSDRTESITSFESSDAAIADSDVFVKLDKGTRTSKAQPLSVKKENDGSPLKRPRKRRVTDSVRSHKSRAALATSKATEGDHKPRSTDAPMKQARKQTTLSTWIKQKK
jgi:serine/threonine protein kinase